VIEILLWSLAERLFSISTYIFTSLPQLFSDQSSLCKLIKTFYALPHEESLYFK